VNPHMAWSPWTDMDFCSEGNREPVAGLRGEKGCHLAWQRVTGAVLRVCFRAGVQAGGWLEAIPATQMRGEEEA
jgi:hypothetical protein